MSVGNKRREDWGFSLIELMVAVGIISLLGSIAIPNFIIMQLKAKRAEAPMILNGILLAEKAYFQSYGTFVDASLEPREEEALNTIAVSWVPCAGSGADEEEEVFRKSAPTQEEGGSGESCGWEAIGWSPEGKVYCNYEVFTEIINGRPGARGYAVCDIDNDDEPTYFTGTSEGSVGFELPGDELYY